MMLRIRGFIVGLLALVLALFVMIPSALAQEQGGQEKQERQLGKADQKAKKKHRKHKRHKHHRKHHHKKHGGANDKGRD